MGQSQHTNEGGVPARGRRLGWRTCLRKGCGRRFQARRHNQRYCREPECLSELRRWQAAKRQHKRRAGVHALEFFQGSPRKIIFDNLKAAVISGSGRSACLHPEFLALCGHFCLEPIACAARDPESKGIVEGGVRYVKHNALAGRGEELRTWEDYQRFAPWWRDEVANEAPPHRRAVCGDARSGGPQRHSHAARAGRPDRRRGGRPPATGRGTAHAPRPPAQTQDALRIRLQLPQANPHAGHPAAVRLRLRGPARLRRVHRTDGNGKVASVGRAGLYRLRKGHLPCVSPASWT